MAITRLTDIITVFDSKWTYGDVKFGYNGEVNQDHDTKYPLMLVTPPESIMPVIYDGREEYSFEINFYNLYSQAAQSAVTLQKRWDNLQDLSNEWLDMVLKKYQDVTVEAYLNDESIEIERIKDTQNDKLVQIKLVFTMSAFTMCFRPVSNYPSDFADLVVWLRADSGVTFDIPTKRVSAWADGSGNNNDVGASNKASQPLRNGYDGANDKAYIGFDGIKNAMLSNINCPISSGFYTIFTVAKQNKFSTDRLSVFNYKSGSIELNVGFNGNRHSSYITNGASFAFYDSEVSSEYAILATSFDGTSGRLTTSVNTGINSSSVVSGWDESITFDSATFNIGIREDIDFSNTDIEEIIVYNRELSTSEKSDIKGYLNLKYKIY